MAQKQQKEVRVKKVSPYPFEVNLLAEGKTVKGQIMKVTTKGMFIDLADEIVPIGRFFEVQFLIPVMNEGVRTMGRVVRFFDRARPKKPEELGQQKEEKASMFVIERLAEITFIELSDDHRNKIERFCIAIRQVEK